MAAIGWAPCRRSALLQGTALRAAALLVLASPATAQIAATARPGGGNVVGGQARIAQTATTTTIDQTSQQAAIDWQSFNVGSQQTVIFQQPNSRSVALNTVVGPNPSEIAGHIDANGQVAIVNQSGVIFDHGAQVDTAGLVVSAAGITTQNFMAGHMVFDQAAHPGARVVNNGTITIRQAGLAALVAPQVANSGLIQAKLGRVILGGAAAYTLDLYGDGLLALNVTGQVTNVSLGGRTVPALVTNMGTILADGGTILLSAAAADGLIRTLVSAGGTIAANSVGTQSGRVLVQGIGGSVTLDGAVSAGGLAAGTTGGQVVADATGAVSIGAHAVVDASGDAGGGLIALGTTAARAAGGPGSASTLTASSTSVAAGARLSANGGLRGKGGHVTLLATGSTSLAGAISVLGGSAGGNGGMVEVSGASVGLTGLVTAGAAHGHMGGLLIDPTNIYVADGTLTAGTGNQAITPATLAAENANITLTATNAVDFAYTAASPAGGNTLNLGANNLTVNAGAGGINVDRGFSIDAGTIALFATNGTVALDTTTGVGLGLGAASAGHAALIGTELNLQGDTGIQLGNANLTAVSGSLTTGLVFLATTEGDITQGATGVITTAELEGAAARGTGGAAGQALLTGNNDVADILSFTTDGNFTLDSGPLATLEVFSGSSTSGGIVAGTAASPAIIELAAPTLNIASPVSAAGGTVALVWNTLGFAPNTANLVTTSTTSGKAGLITFDSYSSNLLTLTAANGAAQNIDTAQLSIGANGTTLTSNINEIEFLGPTDLTSHAATLALFTTTGGTVTELPSGATSGVGISVGTLVGNVGGIALTSGSDAIATIGDFTAGSFALAQPGALTIAGTLASGATALNVGGALSIPGRVTGATALTGSAITIGGSVVGAASLSLNATSGDISETGSLTTASLSGSATGTVALTGSNSVGTLAGFGAGALSFTDAAPLTVGGSLTAASTLALTAPSITVPGVVSAGTNLTLTATTGDISATGGVRAAQLDGSATGNASLTGANTVTTLGSFTASSFTFAGSGNLDIGGRIGVEHVASVTTSGALTIDGYVQGNVTSLAGASITADPGSVITGGASLSLVATAGGITGNGQIQAGTLTGSASGGVTLTDFDTFVQTLGTFTAGSFTLDDSEQLNVTSAVTSPAAVVIEASGVLTVSGSVTGNTVLLSGNFGEDEVPRTTRPLVDQNAALIITGSVVGTATTKLISAGDIMETGQITTAQLTGTADGQTTLTGSNGIAGLGDFNTNAGNEGGATGFTLKNAVNLAVSGTVTGGQSISITDTGAVNAAASSSLVADTVALQGASLTLAGQVNGPTALSLIATNGGITETGSLSTSAALTGSATGNAALTGSNAIGTLGNFTAQGFSFAASGDLDVTGTITGGPSASIAAQGSLSIAGQVGAAATSLTGASLAVTGVVTGTSTLALTTTDGAITDATGTLTAGTLSGSVTGNADLEGTSTVGTIGAFTAADFAIFDTAPLTVSGTLASPGIALQAPSLVLSGSLAAPTGLVSLITSSGAITQTAGSITADFLGVSSAGPSVLPGANAVGRLDFYAVGSLSLTDTIDLLVSGLVSPAGPAAPLITLAAPALTIAPTENLASLSAPGGTIALSTDTLSLQGGVGTGATGLIGLATYTGSTLTLNNASLAQFTTGELSLGSLDGITPSPLVTSIVLPAGLDLGAQAGTLGLFTAPGGTVNSTMGITAGTLVGNAGTVTLTGPNAIDAIGNFTAQDFTFSQAGGIGITGALTASGSVALSSNAGQVSVGGSVMAPATTLSGLGISITGTVTGTSTLGLTTLDGDLTESGSLSSALLTGTIAGNAAVTGGNSLSALGSFTANALTLNNAQDLSISGPVQTFNGLTIATAGTLALLSGGSLAGPQVGLTAGAISLGGDISAPNGRVALATTGGDIIQSGGIATTFLQVNAAGSATLTGANQIACLELSATTGDFALTDGQNLSVLERVVTGSAGAPATLALTAPAIDLNDDGGLLSAQGGTIALTSDALTIGGTVSTGAAGLIGITTLTSPTLSVSSSEIGQFTTGTLYFGSLGQFAPSPLVTDIALTGPINLTGHAATLGLFTTPAGTVSSTDGITAGTLTGIAGTVTLTGPNVIGNLGAFTAQDFTFAQAGDLNVSGIVTTTAGAITSGGSLTVSGNITAPTLALNGSAISLPGSLLDTTSLTLTATAGSIAGAGPVTTALLLGSATGSLSLTGGNRIGEAGSFTGGLSANGFTLNDLSDLTVSGEVKAGATTSITDAGTLSMEAEFVTGSATLKAGAINLGFLLTAPAGLVLTATQGGITETGAVDTALLTGSAAGAVSLTGTNGIGALGNFTGAGIGLFDVGALNVTGAVQGGSGVSITALQALTVSGSLAGSVTSLQATALSIPGGITAATSLSLTASSGDIDAAGTIATPALSFATPGAVNLVGGNSIASLAGGSAASFTLEDAAAVSVTGMISAPLASLTAPAIAVTGALDDATSLSLIANAGSVSGGGVVTTAALSGSATGSLGLTGSNQINGLGDFSAAGFGLQNATALTVSGTVAGGATASITDSAALTVSGSIRGGVVSLTATTVTLPGSVTAPASLSLTATAGDVDSNGTLNSALLSGSATSQFSLSGSNGIATLGTVSGSQVSINDTQPLTVQGSVQGNASLTIADNAGLVIEGALSAPTIVIGGSPSGVSTELVAAAAPDQTQTTVVLQGGSLTGQSISIAADDVQQIGVTRVNQGGGAATLDIMLTGTQGSVAFATGKTQGLIAPTTSLALDLGAGTTSGNVDVAALALTYAAPAATTVSDLTGQIAGVSGPGAASRGTVQPGISASYQFNGCELGAAVCGTVVAQSPDLVNTVPIFVNPASGTSNNASQSEIDFGFVASAFAGSPTNQLLASFQLMAPYQREEENRRRRRHNDDLIIPNISSEDF